MAEMTPEQLNALQEKIKQMSPEELKDFQKKQCIFCQIVAGKIQAKKVYDDENVIAILDINPANPGHILLLTKEHYSIMPQIPDEEIAHLFLAAKQLSNSILRSIDAQGTNIIAANGIAAGQRAQHFMLHIIPRKENDGLGFVLPQKSMDQAQIDAIGDKLAAALGMKQEEKKHSQIPQPRTPAPKEPMPPPPPPQQQITELQKDPSKKDSIDLDDISRILGVK